MTTMESTTLALVIGIITFSLIYMYRHFTKLRRYGLPGPVPLPFLGNILQQLKQGNDYTKQLKQTYGDIVGYYDGFHPSVQVMDPEIIKRIFVKDFTNFTNRQKAVIYTPDLMNDSIFFMADRRWKRTRNLVSPIFSANKLKQMAPLVNKCGHSLGTALEGHIGEHVMIKDFLGRFTMDTITSTTFGLDIDPHNNPDDPLIVNMNNLLRPKKITILGFILAAVFPPFKHLFYHLGITFWPKESVAFYEETGKRLIEERKAERLERPDFIQVLLDAEFDSSKVEHVHHGVGMDSDTHGDKLQRLKDEEVNATAFIFFIAGYETTAATLGFAAHVLQLRPEFDEKLYMEICDELGTDEPTYENVGRLKYMDQFLHEVLRFYPPAPRIQRLCKEDFPLGNGMTIPKDCQIVVPVYTLQHSEDLYTNPEEFNPDRFTLDKKALDSETFLPFGIGPRHCVGMRFAQVVLKMGLVNMLRKVRFVRCEKTQEHLELKVGGLLFLKRPIEVGLEKRSPANPE